MKDKAANEEQLEAAKSNYESSLKEENANKRLLQSKTDNYNKLTQ